MRRYTTYAGLVVLVACHASISDGLIDSGGNPPDAPVLVDVNPDSFVLGPWGTPTPIGIAATAAAEDDSTLSSTGLELVFAILDTANNTKDLYYASRATTSAPFANLTKLAFDTAASEETPRFSADDLTLYFASDRTGTKGGLDIWYVKRPAVGGAWGPVTNLTQVNTTASEKWFMPCGTAGRYMISVNRGTGFANDLEEGVIGMGAATVATPLNSAASETGTFLTQDCLTIYFASTRGATSDLYTSHRMAETDPWPPPTVVTDFGTAANEQDPWMSPDSRIFTFASDAAGTLDVYISTR
jgi:hypothetical protein